MTYSQVFSELDDYLLCISDGEVNSAEEYIEWAMNVVKRAMETGHTKVLFDNRTFHLKLTQLDVSAFADHLESMGAARLGFRLAVVPCNKNPDVSRMVETALRNRSGSYQIFESQDEAKAWLIK